MLFQHSEVIYMYLFLGKKKLKEGGKGLLGDAC